MGSRKDGGIQRVKIPFCRMATPSIVAFLETQKAIKTIEGSFLNYPKSGFYLVLFGKQKNNSRGSVGITLANGLHFVVNLFFIRSIFLDFEANE